MEQLEIVINCLQNAKGSLMQAQKNTTDVLTANALEGMIEQIQMHIEEKEYELTA